MKTAEEWYEYRMGDNEGLRVTLAFIRAVQRDALGEAMQQVDMIKFGYRSQGPEANVLKAAVNQIRALIPKEPT